jgi:tripartite-type tricarboxylate transporter receptor subunit TctC
VVPVPFPSPPPSPHRRRALAALAALALVRPALAQSGEKPIALIVPAPPGGSSDAVGRLVADALGEILETPVRVENIAGNGGVTGTNAIKSSLADGSVIGLAVSSAIIGGKLLSRSAQYNPSEDFDWLGILGSYPNAMVLSTRSNFTTIDAWLAAARKATTPLAYGTFGTGTAGHLAGAYLRQEQGANLSHKVLVSQDEGYLMLSDGRLDVLFDGLPNALVETPRSGHRIVAVTSAARVSALPDVPSFGELWQQPFVVWIGLIAPRHLPPTKFSRLASAIGVLLAEPRHADGMRALGLTFLGLSGRAAKAYIEEDFLRNARLIAKLNDEGVRQ